jgi:hypothetical protein
MNGKTFDGGCCASAWLVGIQQPSRSWLLLSMLVCAALGRLATRAIKGPGSRNTTRDAGQGPRSQHRRRYLASGEGRRHHVDLLPRRKSSRFFQDEDDRQRWHGCSKTSRLRRHDGDRRALPPVEETQEPNGPEDPEQAICTHRIPSQGGSLNTDSHSQCERQVAIETDPSFGAKGSLWCIWNAAPCSRRYGTSALGGAFDCSGVGMDGHCESVLEMQRLKYAPVNPIREFAQNKVGSLGL